MQKNNPVQEKSYKFALHVVAFCMNQMNVKHEYILSKELLRSGTSIGANIEEGLHAPSKKDFVNKFCISFKEAHESRYWLLLMKDSKMASLNECEKLLAEIGEIIALLTAILKKSKESLM